MGEDELDEDEEGEFEYTYQDGEDDMLENNLGSIKKSIDIDREPSILNVNEETKRSKRSTKRGKKKKKKKSPLEEKKKQ